MAPAIWKLLDLVVITGLFIYVALALSFPLNALALRCPPEIFGSYQIVVLGLMVVALTTRLMTSAQRTDS